ncbi:hypothetical protein GGR52DRAFT_559528 [Hypoxylon sp. FL1284]|nr:hypothetical protein GGR52DRAFT_559528 [Hypoxylon sp. FL1284]
MPSGKGLWYGSARVYDTRWLHETLELHNYLHMMTSISAQGAADAGRDNVSPLEPSALRHGGSVYSQDLQDFQVSPLSSLRHSSSSAVLAVADGQTGGRVESSSPRSASPNAPSLQTPHIEPAGSPRDEPPSKNKAVNIANMRKGWEPSYLGKLPQILFLAMFLGFIVGIQVLVYVSVKQEGFAPSSASLHSLGTYGPMFILTLAAAFWSRVDFQAKLVAPWAHMSQGPAAAERSVLLDYLSALQPLVVLGAFQNRDWAVAASSSCSLVLRLIVVLSTALIVLSPTRVHNIPTPIVLRSSFIENGTELEHRSLDMVVGSIPYYNMDGLMEDNLTYPDGTSSSYAFQDIDANISTDAQLHATVEGFRASLDCKSADLRNYSYGLSLTQGWSITGLNFKSENCSAITNSSTFGSSHSTTGYFGRIGVTACDGSATPDSQRLYVFFGEVSLNESGRQIIAQSKQILCQPSYNIDKIGIVRNRTDVVDISTPASNTSRRIAGIHPAAIMSAFLVSLNTAISIPASTFINIRVNETGEVVVADMEAPIAQALLFTGQNNLSLSSLTESVLNSSIARYYEQYAVFLARTLLLKQDSIPSTGTLETEEERLIVGSTTGYIMTALLVLCIALNLVVMFQKPNVSLPKNPSSILGTAVILASSPGCAKSFTGLGPASINTIAGRIRNIKYELLPRQNDDFNQRKDATLQISAEPEPQFNELHYLNAPEDCARAPLVLRSWCMYAIYLVIIGIIIALEATLRSSEANNGIADVPGGEYIQYTWTVIPAAIMSLISMYFSAVDFEVRSLVPYSKLRDGAPFSRSINMDLIDKSMPLLLWTEYRKRSLSALAMSAVVVISALFTIFTGSLFIVQQQQQVTVPVKLQMTGSFLIRPPANSSSSSGLNIYSQLESYGQLESSLILDSNLSYSAFTYENLAFPQFSILAAPNSPQISSLDTVNGSVPALRSRMACRRYGRAEIDMEVTLGGPANIPVDHGERLNILAIDIKGESCRSNIPTTVTHNAELPLDARPDPDFLFGAGDWCSSDGSRAMLCCSDFLYVWGHKTNSSSQDGNSVAALACNETIEAVDVAVVFYGSDLRIDPSSPPNANNASARPSTVDVRPLDLMLVNWFDPYRTLAGGPKSYGYDLDPFFYLLTSSRYGVPPASLDDAGRDEEVAAAIVFQHGVIRAQTLNAGFRGPANETNATLANPPVDPAIANDASTPYDAMLSSNSTAAGARWRLAQDAAATRVLESLLAVALLLSMLTGRLLLLTPTAKLLPRAPTSIASIAALLSDGNTLDLWPRDTQRLSDEEIERALGADATFHLGWPAQKGAGGREQQLQHVTRFGIYAKNTDI